MSWRGMDSQTAYQRILDEVRDGKAISVESFSVAVVPLDGREVFGLAFWGQDGEGADKVQIILASPGAMREEIYEQICAAAVYAELKI